MGARILSSSIATAFSDTKPTVKRVFLSQVALQIIELGSSIQDFQEKNLDYPFSALKTLFTAVSVSLLSYPPLSFEEDVPL